MATQKHPLSALAVYIAVVMTLLGGIGLALATIVSSSGASPQIIQDKTLLQVQIDGAREVRASLAKPIPAPEPLPQITAKLQKPVAKAVAIRSAPKRNSDVAMREARQVFARIDPPAREQSFFERLLGFGPN